MLDGGKCWGEERSQGKVYGREVKLCKGLTKKVTFEYRPGRSKIAGCGRI
jgi:hypothetical protein